MAEAALKLEILSHRRFPHGLDVDGPFLAVLHFVEGEDLRRPLNEQASFHSDLSAAQRSRVGEFAEIVSFHSA